MSAAAVKKKRTTKGRRSGTMLLTQSWRVSGMRWRDASELPHSILAEYEEELLRRKQGDEEKADELLDRAVARTHRDAVRAFVRSRGASGGKEAAKGKKAVAEKWQEKIETAVIRSLKAGWSDRRIGKRLAGTAGKSEDTVRLFAAQMRQRSARPRKK